MKLDVIKRLHFSVCLLAVMAGACSDTATKPDKYADDASPALQTDVRKNSSGKAWNAKAAATYLDARETSWMEWSSAARDHGTFCISCHTAVPYALSRPVLRNALREPAPSDTESKLIKNVALRVRLWNEVEPFYGQNKTAESRATESVLNTLVLANYDAQSGGFSAETRLAFTHMWALQQKTGTERGAWPWHQFNLKPWESKDSQYYGATLAALAAGLASDDYRADSETQVNLRFLREYLDREFSFQSTLNRVVLLWASTRLPGLVSPDRRELIIDEVLGKQQADGGWNTFSLAKTWRDWSFSSLLGNWKRADGTPQHLESDGYATGLAVFALELAGVRPDDPRLDKGILWLIHNQSLSDGSWSAYSLNRQRNPPSMTGRFMSDSATSFAVLALNQTSVNPRPK